ncbi:uncharacterized protein LOC114354111 [Ostrinia furnacalis]|uniref:uncharacterized protein LOC114354111 n=1 Tax=Ostrinia furnacalis TaxID=93504 RepID=UPI00103C7719|nr:uncharacterized protein LOC114354111 [Ostrinia furnacalis]
MIVLMAVKRPTTVVSYTSTKCEITNCLIECSGVMFDRNEESDVISAVMEAGMQCPNTRLSLQHPIFPNETLPVRWMSRMPPNIHNLEIVGGNLRHIPSTSFLGHFAGNLRVLTMEDVTISQWMSDTFVGLSKLKVLSMRNCTFEIMERNALRALRRTVRTLTVINSGKWNPAYITGSISADRLTRVDLSSNYFGRFIRAHTFMGLKSCEFLFLNSCHITAIGLGAFDSLVSIKSLFLNDNFLITVPPSLFKSILTVDSHPTILLHGNSWQCDCLQEDLIKMSKNGLIPIDPTCHRPTEMFGKSFTELQNYCSTFSQDKEIESLTMLSKDSVVTSIDQSCSFGEEPSNNTSLRVVSPIAYFDCPNISFINNFKESRPSRSLKDVSESDWLKPTFLLRNSDVSVMQVGSSAAPNGYGLLWYQSSCPNEVYCLRTIPTFLRVYRYNILPTTEYTFCPIDLTSVAIPMHSCVTYNLSALEGSQNVVYRYFQSPSILYISIGVGLISLGLGAMCVYMIIRKNPNLLKGSKRLVFVRHRNVDALVLPPKIPLRNTDSFMEDDIFSKNGKIFTVPDDSKLYVNHFVRSNSVRSDKSSTPTYISAMQPTEAQLAEWRIRHHFENNSSLISISSDISTFSWANDLTSAEITTNVVYENLK